MLNFNTYHHNFDIALIYDLVCSNYMVNSALVSWNH